MAITTPNTVNFLQPVAGKIQIPRAPNFNYFIQKIRFPGVTLPKLLAPTPFRPLNLAADHIEYDELEISFILDENLSGYFEIYDWMVQLGRPYSSEQSIPAYNAPAGSVDGVQSFATLTLMTNELVPNIQITFEDMLPVHLSGFELQTTADNQSVITASLTMSFRQYTYAQLRG